MGEKELQLLCIHPFETTFLDLYNTNKDALEEYMCALIQLDEVNVHHIIYTTSCEASQVIALLEEYAPSKFFIPKEDILEIAKMPFLPAQDQKLHLINWAIQHHNATRPHRFIDLTQAKECVLVLDEDIRSLRGAKGYTALIQIEPNFSYIAMLESIYKTLLTLNKDSKQRQANALRHLVKQQDTSFVEDQVMMSLNYNARIVNMASGITFGMVNFINKIEKYLCLAIAFKQLGQQIQIGMLKNIKEELANIIRELYTADDILTELLTELQAMRPLTFMGDNNDLNQWQKLSYDLCSCIHKFFEKKLNKVISPNNQILISNNIIKYEQQIVLCKQELDNLSVGLLDLYQNDLSQHTHHAQKGQNNKFYWLVVDGDKRKKDEALKIGMELYKPLLKGVINGEKKFLDQCRLSLDKLRKHYEDKSNGIENKKGEILLQMGDRDSELREERDKTYSDSKKLTQEALFESIIMPTQAKAKGPSLITHHGAYFAGNVRSSVLRANPYIGTSSRSIATLAPRASQAGPAKKADLFELCRSGDTAQFAREIFSQLSVEYDGEDLGTLLPLRFNYHQGCLFLLKGLIEGTYPGQDGHSYSVCLTPPVPLLANVKQNIGVYIAHSEKKMERKVVFDEIKSLLQKSDSYLKIIFPYQAVLQDRVCWLAGEIKLHKKNSDYEVDLTTINPFGPGKFSDENFKVLCNAVTAGIKSIDPSAKITFSNKETLFSVNNPDKYSSGPLVVEIITNSIRGKQSTTDLAATLKIKEVRRGHVNMLKDSLKEVDNRRIRFLSRHLDPEQINLPKKTLLETACQHGQVAIAGFLIDEMSADVNSSLSGFHPVFSGLIGLKNYPIRTNLVRYILQGTTDLSRSDCQGARLRGVVDTQGRSVLHVAVSHGVDGAVETLVKWGIEHPGTVDLYAKNKKNRTALHEAICSTRHGRLHGVIRVLLRYGLGQPKAALETLKEDKEVKQQALTYIIGYLDELIQKVQEIQLRPVQKLQRTISGSFVDLIARGRSGSLLSGVMSPRINFTWKSTIAQICADNKIANLPLTANELNALDQDGLAPIHVTCICGKPELLEHLINLKVNLNLPTAGVVNRKIEGKDEMPELINTKLTPLHLAVLFHKRYPDFITKLLAQGVQFTQDSSQCTALHYAVGRDSKLVELILAHLEKTNSLDVANFADKDNVTALRKALLTGDKATIMPFINMSIWPSENDILFVKSEIDQRENRFEVKKAVCETLEFIKTRYQMQLTVAPQPSPAAASLKSPR